MIFRNAFEMELFEVSSGVLYSFICCFQVFFFYNLKKFNEKLIIEKLIL